MLFILHTSNLLLSPPPPPPRALTFKTVFLVALVSAKHRSELQAFSFRVQHLEDWSSITLLPDPLFMSKIEKACHPDTRVQEVTLKALTPFVGPDLSTDSNNCVVCVIRSTCHTPRTSAMANNVFSPPISRSTLTRLRHLRSLCDWSRQSIMPMNINYAGPECMPLPHKGHDLCAFATSWNVPQTVAARDILRVAQ